jgi:hypothetical protein
MSYNKSLHEAVDRLEELVYDHGKDYADAENQVADLFRVSADDVRAEYDRRAQFLLDNPEK